MWEIIVNFFLGLINIIVGWKSESTINKLNLIIGGWLLGLVTAMIISLIV